MLLLALIAAVLFGPGFWASWDTDLAYAPLIVMVAATVVTLVIAEYIFALQARFANPLPRQWKLAALFPWRAFGIIWKVIIPEAKPALITGAVISTVTILGYSAMAGTIGGGGLGQIAITYGYQKYDDQIVWLCVALTIIIVQILQEFGMYIARRTDRRART